MRLMLALVPVMMVAMGCAMQSSDRAAVDPLPTHPMVRVQGIDGTFFTGELLNGSVTVDSGQGPLTLMTDHINTIVFSNEADTVDSASVKVSGKIKEPLFQLKSEHGVFILVKERLKRIEFVKSGTNTGPTAPAMASTNPNAQPAKTRQALIIP
jgi:hypothetical protein